MIAKANLGMYLSQFFSPSFLFSCPVNKVNMQMRDQTLFYPHLVIRELVLWVVAIKLFLCNHIIISLDIHSSRQEWAPRTHSRAAQNLVKQLRFLTGLFEGHNRAGVKVPLGLLESEDFIALLTSCST